MNKIEQRLLGDPAIRSMLLDLERITQRRQLAEIQSDPAAHRDTTLMGAKGLHWRYWTVKTGKTARVNFCYATTPNAAGFYLTWQETINSKGNGKRQYIRGHKLRRDAKESALKSFERFKSQSSAVSDVKP